MEKKKYKNYRVDIVTDVDDMVHGTVTIRLSYEIDKSVMGGKWVGTIKKVSPRLLNNIKEMDIILSLMEIDLLIKLQKAY
jgi:hypothetical protein